MSVQVYSTPTCPYCTMVKGYLKSKGIQFEDYDVSNDAGRAEEMIRKSGQMGVPVTDVDGKIIVGFSPVQLERALKAPK